MKPRFAALLWILTAASAALAQDATPAGHAAREFHHDFRGARPLPPGWRVGGNLDDALLRPEAEGFRISVPAGRLRDRAGLDVKMTLDGDFEITAAYEILHADQPTEGYGVGFELFVHTLPEQGIGVYRVARVKQGDVYMVSRNRRNDDGKIEYRQAYRPTTARAGRLRLTRAGSKATAWAAEPAADAFERLAEFDLGRDDVSGFWLMAFTGHSQTAVELRLSDVWVRGSSGSASTEPPAPAAAGDEVAPRSWSKLGRVLALVLLVLLGSVCVVYIYVRRQAHGPESE